MSTFVIPHHFALDASISAADMDACFRYVRDYINGALPAGGIDANNISPSMKFLGSQIAQDRGLSVASVTVANGEFVALAGGVPVAYFAVRRLFTPPFPTEIAGIRVRVKKSQANQNVGFCVGVFPESGTLLTPPNVNLSTSTSQSVNQAAAAIGGFGAAYDDSVQQNWGMWLPPIPGKAFSVGQSSSIYIMSWAGLSNTEGLQQQGLGPGPFNTLTNTSLNLDYLSISLKLAAQHSA
jgi:hypothetical protein